MKNLSEALGGKKLSLRSDAGNGIQYTAAEHKLAMHCLLPLLAAIATGPNAIKFEAPTGEKVPNDVVEAVNVAAANAQTPSVAGLAKTAYRAVVTSKIGSAKDLKDKEGLSGNKDFPKHRDQTSVGLIFRAACEQLKISKENIDKMFPRYGTKKKAA